MQSDGSRVHIRLMLKSNKKQTICQINRIFDFAVLIDNIFDTVAFELEKRGMTSDKPLLLLKVNQKQPQHSYPPLTKANYVELLNSVAQHNLQTTRFKVLALCFLHYPLSMEQQLGMLRAYVDIPISMRKCELLAPFSK